MNSFMLGIGPRGGQDFHNILNQTNLTLLYNGYMINNVTISHCISYFVFELHFPFPTCMYLSFSANWDHHISELTSITVLVNLFQEAHRHSACFCYANISYIVYI